MKKILFMLCLVVFSLSLHAQRDTTIVSYYENGNVREIILFNDRSELHGECSLWAENGTKVGEASYKNGKKEGTWKVWDKEGNLVYEMHYKRGKRSGVWKMYDKNGECIKTVSFNR